MPALYRTEKRLGLITDDLARHFEARRLRRNRCADGNPFRIRPPPPPGGQPERHRRIPELQTPGIVPSNRRLRFDGPHFSPRRSAIRPCGYLPDATTPPSATPLHRLFHVGWLRVLHCYDAVIWFIERVLLTSDANCRSACYKGPVVMANVVSTAGFDRSLSPPEKRLKRRI